MRTERQTKGGDRSVTFLQYSSSCSKSQTNALSIFYLVRIILFFWIAGCHINDSLVLLNNVL